MQLKGYQRKYLRSLAHHLKPVVVIGKQEITKGSYISINNAFNSSELIKIKINKRENIEKQTKLIEDNCLCYIVGDIGKILIAYKINKDPECRKIKLPIK